MASRYQYYKVIFVGSLDLYKIKKQKLFVLPNAFIHLHKIQTNAIVQAKMYSKTVYCFYLKDGIASDKSQI